MLDAANIDAPDMAPRKQVVTDFMARNPDVTMDWRALPSKIQWDRVARTTLLSGEQVDLVNINGQFIRAWVRDGLLDDLSAHGQLQNAFASVNPSFLAAQSDGARDSLALPVTHASPAHVTAFFYNKSLLGKAGLQPPKTLDDMRAMVQPSFIVGVGNGLILGYLMFRSGLVPRPMALLGLIGGPLLCLAGIAVLFGVLEPGSAQQSLAAMPEFFWELSLGIYLTVKGFRLSTAASQPARTAPNELLAAV